METADVMQLKHDALHKIIFHMTPKQWLAESGPWVLDRGEGALLYDRDRLARRAEAGTSAPAGCAS